MKAKKIRTKVSPSTLNQIIKRARLAGLVTYSPEGEKHWYSETTMRMDLMACVSGAFRDDQAVPGFSLDVLLASDDFDFTHDVAGIARHMDRTTGDMGGCFMPRCARGRVTA